MQGFTANTWRDFSRAMTTIYVVGGVCQSRAAFETVDYLSRIPQCPDEHNHDRQYEEGHADAEHTP